MGSAADALRSRIVDAAARTIEGSGPEMVRARALTAEVGASTQALYTLFGGMPGLFNAVVADGFARLADYVDEVPESHDAVADFIARGWAYSEWALAHPQLYRLMFGLTGGDLRHHAGLEMAVAGAVAETPQAQSALDLLVHSMSRVVESGRIDPVDPVLPAGQFLSATHGWVLLEIAGAFGAQRGGLEIIRALGVNLMVGLGDSREDAAASFQRAETARAAPLESGG